MITRKHGLFNSHPRIRKPKRIIVHHTAGGNLSGAEATLKKRGLGYHYMIDKDGTIVEYVKPSRKCYHAYRNNTGTVGVSFVGGGKFGELNAKQRVALVNVCIYIKDLYPTVKEITGHKHVDSRGWKIDPRFPGEPANGIDWAIDKIWMDDLAEDTGLKFVSRHDIKKRGY